MQLDLRKLTHFVAVVEERSITRAARRLQLTQQALSMSIRALERELGVPLIERGHGGVELLPAGRSLYADGVPLLGAASAAVVRARGAVGGRTELLRATGVEPRHRVSTVQGMPPVTAVLGNDGVALVTEAPGPAVGGAVQVLELEPSTTVPLVAAWRSDARSRARDLLLDALLT